ncbi:MAG: D-alanine--D-alanine ligase [Armatimonadota bacterium]|nr:D-alanine--D-alanine ligase [Armatimonadota bacterium]MDR7434194.1 D-alanine--D-alanine ligase [Armatimonadota bacterium]
MSRLKVAVLMGGTSAEREVSLQSGQNIVSALDPEKYTVIPVEVTEWRGSRLLETLAGVDLVFIALHGPYGEDGTVQGFLELLDVPYTGSGVLSSALAMDKIRSRQIFQWHGIPVPRYLSFQEREWRSAPGDLLDQVASTIGFPCVVKPADQGSSIGVSIVHNPSGFSEALEVAFRYSQAALVEERIAGTEITCGILDDPHTGLPEALPLIEIVPKREFFDYEAKYTPGATEEICPARIPPHLAGRAQEIAVRAYRALGCRDMGRVDMFLRGEEVLVLEVNTIPGMTRTSLLPQAAKVAGIDFPALLDRVIQSALRRSGGRDGGQEGRRGCGA